MNAPNRYELYVLEEGERSVEVSEDTKIPNAATIKIVKQDHTLANLLRSELLSMPQVLFAGYKVPHPLHPYFLLKIQTDGSVTPTQILETACTKLIGAIAGLESKFQREFTYKDVDGGIQEDAYGAPVSAGNFEGRDYVDLF
ncbi:RBP11-like subunits of RNA polymerase [Trametes maxima]|nr:RBP11-like subunits of RNA polymerase [Trametes maxima]